MKKMKQRCDLYDLVDTDICDYEVIAYLEDEWLAGPLVVKGKNRPLWVMRLLIVIIERKKDFLWITEYMLLFYSEVTAYSLFWKKVAIFFMSFKN